jgi:hypothetical protein
MEVETRRVRYQQIICRPASQTLLSRGATQERSDGFEQKETKTTKKRLNEDGLNGEFNLL